MRRNHLSLTVLSAIVLLAAGLAPQAFASEINYTQDFTGPDGSFPADWFDSTHGSFSNNIVDINNNQLRMRRDASNPSSLARNAAYVGGDSATWDNYTVEVLFTGNTESQYQATGILGRWQGASSINSGYFAYEMYGTPGVLKIGKDYSGQGDAATVLASTSLARTVHANEVTRLVFQLNGEQLTAWLYAEGSTPGVYDDLLGTVTTTDSTYSQGSAGLRAGLGGYNREALFDDFSVTSIPEPAAVSMLALGVMLLVGRVR